MAQLNNLVVTGAARFLNPIYGNLTGTASSLSNFTVSTTSSVGLEISTNVHGYVSGLTKANWNSQQNDGALYGQFYDANWKHEIYGDYRTGQIAVRGKNNGTWTDWKSIGMFTASPTSGQVIITDGTYGGIKSSGYTIAKSVPSDAKFTDTTYTLSADTTNNKITLTPSSGTAQSITVPFATSATSATKLSANAGSATNPVYFTGGVPTACTYSLNKTVPSDAVFTDTNTHRPIQVNGTEILGNNTTALNLKAGSNVSVTNSNGTVTIAATDTNNAVTQTATTTTGNYEVLFSATADNTTRTEGARKTSGLIFNPGTNNLTVGGEIISGSGLELGMASADTASFIDFHWGSNNTDYTARIIQRSESTLDLIGKNGSTWGIWKAASFSSQSSILVKENISSITDDEAKKLLQLRPVVFDYKGDGLKNQRGLIAEEVMNIMPEMVIIPQGYTEYDPVEPWNTPCIDYSKFVPHLIKMVQIQQNEINELKAKIKD